MSYPVDNKVDGATFLLLEKDDLHEIVKSVGIIKQLQKLQTELLGATVSVLCHLDCCFLSCVHLIIQYNSILFTGNMDHEYYRLFC